MSELPESWSRASILDLSTMIRGVTYSKGDAREQPGEGLVPILRANNITDAGLTLDDLVYVPRRFVSDDQFVRTGDVVVATSSGSINVVGKARQATTDLNAGFGAFCAVLRPGSELDRRFFGYFLRTDEYRALVSSLARGVNINNLKRSHFEQITVPLPPLAEQQRIADKLDALLARVDACRARLGRVSALLKRFRQAVLAAAVAGRLTEDWREVNGIEDSFRYVALSDTGSEFSYGTSAKSASSGTTPVLRMGNIQEGKLIWDDLVYTSDQAEIAKYRLNAGDVLFNRTNSPELVGKAAVYHGEQPAIYAGYLIRVRCEGQLLPEYLNFCLNSPDGRDYCWRVKSDGVSQSNINAKKLAAFQFWLPPLAEQHEIVRRVETLFAFADRLEARLAAARARVEQLTPSLLGQAFRGELGETTADAESNG